MNTKIQKKPTNKGRKLVSLKKTKVKASALSQKTIQSNEISRPRKDYPEIETLGQLNVVAEHWLSDIQFFKDEIRFLHSLISKYFVWLTDDENIQSTKEIARGLSALEKQRESLEHKIRQHIHTYRNLFENPFANDRNQFKQEHAQLESELTELVKGFRPVKQQTFALTEVVIQSENVKHLLSN